MLWNITNLPVVFHMTKTTACGFYTPDCKNHSIVVFRKTTVPVDFDKKSSVPGTVKNHSIPPVGMLWNFTKLPVVFYILVKNHCQWFSYAVVFYM